MRRRGPFPSIVPRRPMPQRGPTAALITRPGSRPGSRSGSRRDHGRARGPGRVRDHGPARGSRLLAVTPATHLPHGSHRSRRYKPRAGPDTNGCGNVPKTDGRLPQPLTPPLPQAGGSAVRTPAYLFDRSRGGPPCIRRRYDHRPGPEGTRGRCTRTPPPPSVRRHEQPDSFGHGGLSRAGPGASRRPGP
jgi:hypothetical protein